MYHYVSMNHSAWVSRLTKTDQNGPKRAGTDRNGPTKIPKRTSMDTETGRNRLQLIPKRTSMGARKGEVGYDRNTPNKSMYVLVGRYVGRYECM